MSERTPVPSLPNYPKGVSVASADQQKPIMKMLGKMLASRFKIPQKTTISQSIKIKHKKKVTYW